MASSLQLELPLLGGVQVIVTSDQEEYVARADRRERVFLFVELESIMHQSPTRRDMEWILIQKRLQSGCWILDVKGREVGFPEGVCPL